VQRYFSFLGNFHETMIVGKNFFINKISPQKRGLLRIMMIEM